MPSPSVLVAELRQQIFNAWSGLGLPVMVVIAQDQAVAIADALDALSDDHECSFSGIDQTPDGPDKVWRSDCCGALKRNAPDPTRPGISIAVPVEEGKPT